MGAGKLEAGAGMVEGGWLPGIGRVAGLAVAAELAVMGIIAGMAGNTGAGGAFETFAVARKAGSIGMRSGKLEAGAGMIEGGWFPGIG